MKEKLERLLKEYCSENNMNIKIPAKSTNFEGFEYLLCKGKTGKTLMCYVAYWPTLNNPFIKGHENCECEQHKSGKLNSLIEIKWASGKFDKPEDWDFDNIQILSTVSGDFDGSKLIEMINEECGN